MKPEVINTDYYALDGPCGTEFVPADLVPDGVALKYGDEYCGPVPNELRDFCENTECHQLEFVENGWLARLSMPGCLDATVWIAAESEADALEQLLSMLGTQDDSDREQWETDAIEWLADHYIEADATTAHDVAASHGQILANVKHTEWFREALIEHLNDSL